jgi:hypothetical protein
MAVPVGVVISLETSSLETPLARILAGPLFVAASIDGDETAIGRASWGFANPLHDATLLVAVGGPHSVVGRLLATSLGALYCLAISSAVRDNVVGRRLRHRQSVKTWPATDRSGVFDMAGNSQSGTSSQDGAGDIFNPLAR